MLLILFSALVGVSLPCYGYIYLVIMAKEGEGDPYAAALLNTFEDESPNGKVTSLIIVSFAWSLIPIDLAVWMIKTIRGKWWEISWKISTLLGQ